MHVFLVKLEKEQIVVVFFPLLATEKSVVKDHF